MVDGFATFFRVLVMVVAILTVLPSYRFLDRQNAETGEFHALLLFSIAGQCVVASANDLIIIFIGLEISSISSYVLAGYLRDDKRDNEAALKYFLLGSFATAFFLYGVALIYGSTGSINLICCARRSPGRTLSPFSWVAAASCSSVLGSKSPPRPSRSGPRTSIRALPPRGGVHVGGTQSGGLRRLPAHLHDRLRIHRPGLGTAGLDVRPALHDHRQLRRAAAIQHQAPVGLQFHRACRIRAGSVRAVEIGIAPPCSTWRRTR